MVMMENARQTLSISCMEHPQYAAAQKRNRRVEYFAFMPGSANTTADDVYAIRDHLDSALRYAAVRKLQSSYDSAGFIITEKAEKEHDS